jgi:hypothetical protein
MPKITASGSLSNNFAQGASTLTVASPTLGYLRVLTAAVNATTSVTGVSGGGVGTWNQAVTNTANSQWLGLWWGQVTSTVTSPTTVTATYSGSVASTFTELVSQMYSSDRKDPKWFLDSASSTNSASATTVTFPTLTPAASTPELYFGIAFVAQTGSAGSTSGFTNGTTSGGSNPYTYNTALAASATPTASESPAGFYNTVAALIGVIDLSQFFV